MHGGDTSRTPEENRGAAGERRQTRCILAHFRLVWFGLGQAQTVGTSSGSAAESMRLGSDDSQVRDRLSPARTRAEGTGMCVGGKILLWCSPTSAYRHGACATGTLTNQMNPAPAYASRSHQAAQPASSSPSSFRPSSASDRVLSVKNFSVRKCPNSKGRRGCVRPHWHGSTSWSPSACRHCGTLLSLL